MSKIKILHISSHYEDCGIAKYQEQFFEGMEADDSVENVFFEYSPYKTRVMNNDQLRLVYDKLSEQLGDYDILHIQHEFGFYAHDEFSHFIRIGKALGKKIIVTIHASPSTALKPKDLGGYSPRNVIKFLRDRKHNEHIIKSHLLPLREADLVLVHNEATKHNVMADAGVSEDHIRQIVHPVPVQPGPIASSQIHEALAIVPGDIVFATIGFLHKYKGVDSAIRALKFLPENYKLAVIGGMHATTSLNDIKLYDKLSDLIVKLDLQSRVYITGFIKDDSVMSGLIQEVDMCVYPYDGQYYSNVSSGALNLAMANHKPIIGYPTLTFSEMNRDAESPIVLTKTFSYYELAREIKNIHVDAQVKPVDDYAKKYSWPKLSVDMIDLYKEVVS